MTPKTALTILIIQIAVLILAPAYWPDWVRLLPLEVTGLTVLVLGFRVLLSQARGRKYRR